MLSRSTKKNTGFSLVEMIVVVAIIIVITSVLLFKQSKFSSDILVTNAAYEIALSIREAQVYGISSKQGTGGTNSNVGYGVYLNSAPSSSFIIYSDSDQNYPFNFNAGNPSEYTTVETPTLTQGQTIKRFCLIGGSCSDTGLAAINIGFIKPNPEALIHDNSATKFAGAIIVVSSSIGDKCRVVRVTSIGQISVDTPLSDGSECTSVRS